MRRLKRNPGRFETLDLYRVIARQEGYTFSNTESSQLFIDKLNDEFSKAKTNPITLHGIRTQAMFEYIAASLGKCAVIKAEDSGDIHVQTTDIQVPDFRLLLLDGQEIFVEVKNFYQKNPLDEYPIRKTI